MGEVRVARMISAAVLLVLALSGCTTPGASRPAPEASTDPAVVGDGVTFTSVVDGDTIETSAGTVRLMGIDTPERGECGHDDASLAIGKLVAPGDAITLELTDGQNDTDNHGRLIRVVTTADGTDLGMMQLEAGNAVARYDSRDGYPAHPYESAYHDAQKATLGPGGVVITTACEAAAQPAPAPAPVQPAPTQAAPTPAQPEVDRWWEQYASCTKLKKNTVGDPMGPFSVNDPSQAEIYDWFAHGTGNNGDGDDDGLACE